MLSFSGKASNAPAVSLFVVFTTHGCRMANTSANVTELLHKEANLLGPRYPDSTHRFGGTRGQACLMFASGSCV